MKKFDRFEKMHPMQIRNFLKALSFALASPIIPIDLKYACNEIIMGTQYANAQALQRPTYFIEINFRDQWDFAHVFVAPGIANYPRLVRGVGDYVALFDDPA